MPIKALHLTNYWHERSGGIATFYRQLMDAVVIGFRIRRTRFRTYVRGHQLRKMMRPRKHNRYQTELKDVQTQ
jgi:hypothetical protein